MSTPIQDLKIGQTAIYQVRGKPALVVAQNPTVFWNDDGTLTTLTSGYAECKNNEVVLVTASTGITHKSVGGQYLCKKTGDVPNTIVEGEVKLCKKCALK